jgi:hypothetical protein
MLSEFAPYTIHRPEESLRPIETLAQTLHIRVTPFSMKPQEYLTPIALKQDYSDHLHTAWCMYAILKRVFHSQAGVLLIDDRLVCVETVPNIRAVLKEAEELTDQPWDLLIMAADGYTCSKPITHKLDRVFRVRGSKMVYIHKYIVANLLITFERALSQGILLYGDRLLNAAIYEHGLYALGVSQTKAYLR